MVERGANPERSGRTGTRTARLTAIRALAEQSGWLLVDEAAWMRIKEQFDTVSAQTLRRDLRETGLPLHPLVEGVRLDGIENLARTLLALAAWETPARVTDPQARISAARRLVLEARRKTETVLRNRRVAEEKKGAMEENLLWIRTWLENPGLFEIWAALRLKEIRNPPLQV